MNWNIDTKEGMEEAKRWLENTLRTVQPGGTWTIPRSMTIYEIHRDRKTVKRLLGPGDRNTERVLREIGWDLLDSQGENRREAQFAIIHVNAQCMLIRDIGPWDKHPTVTNDAEGVVARLAPLLVPGQRLEYIDSEGCVDELAVKDGKFAGFIPGRRKAYED